MKNVVKNAVRGKGKRKIAIVCVAVVSLCVVAFGCERVQPSGTETEHTGNIQYVKTELGGCNLGSEQKSSDTETKGDTVIITISGDSVHIFVGLNFACKELPFETRYEIIDDVIVIHIVDSGGEYYRCICYYTFDFVFKYQGEINQKYKILLHQTHQSYGEEPIFIFSEGIITNNTKR